MSEHTKEPWRYESMSGFCSELVGADGKLICAFVDDPTELDARRIVACVNSLAGVPTDWLEKFTLSKSENVAQENARLTAELAEARAERDAKIKQMAEWLKDAIEPLDTLTAQSEPVGHQRVK